MTNFFDEYLNIKKMIESKRDYRELMKRVNALPEDYRYVFKKIQSHMWMFAAGSGYDMMKIHEDLLDLFETGVSEGKHVLAITGHDVASFCEELLKNARTYTDDWRTKLNRDIAKKFGKEK
jgi:DNA-binding ferritin-like protein (Dps family)